MSNDTDALGLMSFYIVIGIPMLIAYLVVGVDWAVELGTFTCAWWACWILWTNNQNA